MQLDCVGTDGDARVDLVRLGIDEQGDFFDARVEKARQQAGQPVAVSDYVESALGRQLFAAFGHERGEVRLRVDTDLDDLFGHAQLKVQFAPNGLFQALNVTIGDVAAVFAQVENDAMRPGGLAGQRGVDRIGERFAARVAQRRDVVDVDEQARRSAAGRRVGQRKAGAGVWYKYARSVR